MYGLPPDPAYDSPPLVYDGAPVGRRAMAWLLDDAVVFVFGLLLMIITMHRISASFTTVMGLKGKSFWDVLSSSDDIVHNSLELWRSSVVDAEEALAVLVLLEFAYVFAGLAMKGRTLGKALLDVQVRVPVGGVADGDLTVGQAARRAGITTLTNTGLYSLSLVVLLNGSFALSFGVWVIAVAAFWVNVLPITGTYRRTLADRAAGTVVIRTNPFQEVLRQRAESAPVRVPPPVPPQVDLPPPSVQAQPDLPPPSAPVRDPQAEYPPGYAPVQNPQAEFPPGYAQPWTGEPQQRGEGQ